MKDIEEAVSSCDREKSSILDEFNIGFSKACRDIVKDDLFRFVNEFYMNFVLPKVVSASFLSLIPKFGNP